MYQSFLAIIDSYVNYGVLDEWNKRYWQVVGYGGPSMTGGCYTRYGVRLLSL